MTFRPRVPCRHLLPARLVSGAMTERSSLSWAGRTSPRESCVREEALTSRARLFVDPMRDWSRSDELRSLAPLADLSRSHELMIFFESRSDRLSDVGELFPTVLLGAAPTSSAPDARTSGVFGFPALHISKAPSGLPPRGSGASSMHHMRLPLVLSSHCSRLFTRTTRARNTTRQGPGEKNTRAHHNVSDCGKVQGVSLATCTRGPLPFGHPSLSHWRTTLLDALPNSMGLNKWSLTSSEEPGKGDLDEVVVAPVPEYM